jgi:hypothetical protein
VKLDFEIFFYQVVFPLRDKTARIEQNLVGMCKAISVKSAVLKSAVDGTKSAVEGRKKVIPLI